MWSLPVHALPAAALTRDFDFSSARHASALQVPQLGQRAGGDVETAIALLMQRRGKVQQVGGLVIDVDWVTRIRTRADARDQTVVAIVRVFAIEALDFGLGNSRCGSCNVGGRFELQLARATHGTEAKAMDVHALSTLIVASMMHERQAQRDSFKRGFIKPDSFEPDSIKPDPIKPDSIKKVIETDEGTRVADDCRNRRIRAAERVVGCAVIALEAGAEFPVAEALAQI